MKTDNLYWSQYKEDGYDGKKKLDLRNKTLNRVELDQVIAYLQSHPKITTLEVDLTEHAVGARILEKVPSLKKVKHYLGEYGYITEMWRDDQTQVKFDVSHLDLDKVEKNLNQTKSAYLPAIQIIIDRSINNQKPDLVNSIVNKKKNIIESYTGSDNTYNNNSYSSYNHVAQSTRPLPANKLVATKDVNGEDVVNHLKTKTKEARAASTIQRAWRQTYRARRLHRDAKLFGARSQDSRNNRRIVLPKQFGHLAYAQFPTIITRSRHGSSHLKDIFHDGVIYPKIQSKNEGIGGTTDAERFENRLAFSAPFSDYASGNSIAFDLAVLFANNHKDGVYFKFYDWVVGLPSTPIRITNEIEIEFRNQPFDLSQHVQFMFRDTTNPNNNITVDVPNELLVYHGHTDLNRYLTLFLFSVLARLPQTHHRMRDKIYSHFADLDKRGLLVNHLQACMKDIIGASEVDFVSPVVLRFKAITEIKFDGEVFDLEMLRQLIRRDDIQGVSELIKKREFYKLCRASYFLIKGMRQYAEECRAAKISAFLLREFNALLSLQEQADKEIEMKKQVVLLSARDLIPSSQYYSKLPSGLCVHRVSAQEYYVKYYDNPDQVRAEVLAAKLYQMAGIAVPETTLVKDDRTGKLGVASVVEKNLQSIANAKIPLAQLFGCHEGFIVDAWLANWDVVGLTKDNMYIVADEYEEQALRLDLGAALHYRARGQMKPDFFSSTGVVSELETLRDPKINPQAAEVFAGISNDDLKIGAARLSRISSEQITDAVYSCYPDEVHKELRAKITQTLIARRNYIVQRYKITLSDPIELIARDIIGQHYQTHQFREKHGGRHVSKTAIFISIMAALYRKKGYQITPEEVKLMQIAALFHDSCRLRDTGDDSAIAERRARDLCFQHLMSLGVKRKLAEQIADSIENKDSSMEDGRKKSIYRKLLQNADCFEVLRSENWSFDYKYTDYFKEFGASDLLYQVIDESAQFEADTHDLHRAHNCLSKRGTIQPTFSLEQKKLYEADKHCFQRIRAHLKPESLLAKLYAEGLEGLAVAPLPALPPMRAPSARAKTKRIVEQSSSCQVNDKTLHKWPKNEKNILLEHPNNSNFIEPKITIDKKVADQLEDELAFVLSHPKLDQHSYMSEIYNKMYKQGLFANTLNNIPQPIDYGVKNKDHTLSGITDKIKEYIIKPIIKVGVSS